MEHLVVGDVLVGGYDTQDDGAGLLHVLPDHLGGHLVYVLVLAVDGDACQPRQVDDG